MEYKNDGLIETENGGYQGLEGRGALGRFVKGYKILVRQEK
jgi:hypothetical protein